MTRINSRADLEALRGTDAFEPALKALYGAMTIWGLVDGAWVGNEDLTAIERLGFTKAQFLDEIAPFGFTAPVAPELPPADPSPLTLNLSKRQINAALILSGHTDPGAFIETAIAAIVDVTARALALNDWRNAPYYKRDHDLFNDVDLLGAANLTSAQVDGLWVLASQQLR